MTQGEATSFEDYLKEQSVEGTFDSKGAFTMDFAEAAERLATFRLPSENHYLLKVVQLASRLGAESLRIKLESFRTSVHFRAPRAGQVTDAEAITRAFLAPLEVTDPLLADLAAALWGCLGESTQEINWSFSQGYRGRRVFIKDLQFRSEDFQIEKPIAEGELPCAFTLSVVRKKTWKFWLNSRRNADAYLLLKNLCGFSRVTLFVDGRELERWESSCFTAHRPRSGDYGAGRLPYHSALYALTEQGGFEINRPNLSQYVVRERSYNVWASATRARNSLAPDGISSPAWLLQFHDGKENLSMRSVAKRARCRLFLAFDDKDPAYLEPLRMQIVRQSVLLEVRRDAQRWETEFPKWAGCWVILDEDSLDTDLTGFQIIEDQRLGELLESLEPSLALARLYLEEGSKLAYGFPKKRTSRED